MYYRSVNRGLTLTTPGGYTIGLVLVLGFIAIASGYNGIFLSLSLGFSILIISGLLSEKTMKHYSVEAILPARAEAGAPFTLQFRVANESPGFVLYGMENLAFPKTGKALPKLRFFSSEAVARMASVRTSTLSLLPGAKAEAAGSCAGLPRGWYDEFDVVQRTLFPFGLLAKFKISTLPAEVAILPRLDETLATRLRQDILRRVSGDESEREFHSHRPYTPRDALRFVDWKKNARLGEAQWVVKQFESLMDRYGILVEPAWEILPTLTEESAYEGFLSTIWTACAVARDSGRAVALKNEGGELVHGHDACARRLVTFPRRGETKPRSEAGQDNGSAVAGLYLRLTVRDRSYQWQEPPVAIH